MHRMATGRYVPLSVKGIKGEVSKVDSMPVALIGLPLIVQALENPESLDGMCKGNPRAARSLQFVPRDTQPDRLTVTGRAVVKRPSTHFCKRSCASRSRLRSSRCFRSRSLFSIA